ncbi:hypothetical protein MNBD_NITROSPINAE03-1912 [hydrothermal vent metagenome]|uniref:Copper resistance protein D domain-containing protein n=1 Tax=hydrothermal vent metagenome TaxID=652676 RepID=A0A3B1B9V1_9ZZZZ
MDDITLARSIHVIGVVLWIGGVGMVTTVVLPAVRRFKSAQERLKFFEEVEGRFAWQARFTTQLTGLSGLYMLYSMDAWSYYGSLEYWWVSAMTALWALFTLMLFVIEPLFLRKWFAKKAKSDPEGTFRIIQFLHIFLLIISLIVVFGAVTGAHGAFIFGS